jgi:hypothetical protein
MLSKSRATRLGFVALAVAIAAGVFGGQAWADETLGPSLPAPRSAGITQGGPPNFADTYVTPYVASSAGVVSSWKAEFDGGSFPVDPPFGSGPGVPVGIQLKIFRHVSPTLLQVVGAGAVHDPRPILEARLPGYPFFLTSDSVIEFSDPGLTVLPGDVIGLTLKSDPFIGRYGYPLVGSADTPIVLRDVPLGGTIDLSDIFVGHLQWPPAVQVSLTPPVKSVRIDIKPGSLPNSINLGSNGTVAVAIFSGTSFDATTVDPLSVTLAGASVALKGRGTAMSSFQDVDGDGLLDLVVHVSTDALQLTDTDTQAVLEGTTFDGTRIRGTDSVRVVN